MLDTVSARTSSSRLLIPALPVHGSELVSNRRTRLITVCHPVWQLGCGGTERHLVQVVNRLPQESFRHVVVVLGWNRRSEPIAAQLGDHVDVIKHDGPHQDRTFSRRLAAILHERDVDVLHVRGLSMLLDAVIASELHGVSSVACSFHGFESADTQFKGVRRKVLREALLRCDDRWAVSAAAARAITHRLNMPRETFGVLTNGVDTVHYHPSTDRDSLRKDLNLPLDQTVLLSVGTLKPIKGHEVLLKAMQHLGTEAKGAVLVLVGADELGGGLQRWAARHLPGVDVRFVGKQLDVRRWYQAADVFVLPSMWEGLSNALLEAMACGRAIIATRVGGNLDVLEDHRTALLVEPSDAPGLGTAIGRLLGDERLRSQLGTAARQEIERRFSVGQTLAAHAERYLQLADRSQSMTAQAKVIEPGK